MIATLSAATGMYAETVSNDVVYGTLNGTIEYSNVAFKSVSTGTIDPINSNIAYNVQDGSTVELTGDYTLTETAAEPVFCPGCIVQDYLAFEQPNAVGSAGVSQHGGDFFTSGPTPFDVSFIFGDNNPDAGTYYIGDANTLDFQFDPNRPGGPGIDGVSFSAEIVNPTPEPASLLMLGMGLAGIGVGIRRKIAR
jgi:hypothetical protein